MSLNPATRLGAYEIVGALGAGGMGEVYRARDTKLNRDVAIKVLPPAFAQDRDRLTRFEREAQSLAALNHPHIAQIYGVLDAPSALVMEFADGEDLSERLRRGPIPTKEALALAIQIAAALGAAHERGIIHRDLKPANIKLTDTHGVKVLDFGLAKAMVPEPSAIGAAPAELQNSPTFTSPAMTMMGMVLGTAAYMAPEQAKGKPVDRRADVWAFGGVLYEMLTGKRAFEGVDVTDVIASIMRAEPDWTALPADTPASIRKLLKRCLEKDRATRLDSMAVARYEIEESLSGTVPASATTVAAPARPLWRRVLPLAGSAAAAALLTGLVAWSAKPSPPSSVVRFPHVLPDTQSMSIAARRVLAVSPDGQRLAYVANREVYVRALDSIQAVRVFANEARQGLANLAFSPDGETLAFSLGPSIVRVPVAGGSAHTVVDPKEVHDLAWAGESLIYVGEQKITRVPASGGQPETLVTLAQSEYGLQPQLLPDGRTLLFTVATGNSLDRWDNAAIVLQRVGETTRTRLVEKATSGRYLPSGHLAYVQSGVLFAAPFDVASGRLTGAAVPVVEGVARGTGIAFGGAAHWGVSENGTLVYVPGPKEASSRARSLLVLADGAGQIESLKLPPGPYSEPRLSPNDRYIAFSSDDGTQSNIWVYDRKNGGAARRLTFGGGERFPLWSPDSTRITYLGDRNGDLGIYWQRADGSDVPVRLTKPEAGTVHIPHAWNKDGSVLLIDVRRGTEYVLSTFTRATGTVAPFGGVVSRTITTPTVSPDGRWVAYTRRDNDTASFAYVQPFPATGAVYQVSKGDEDGHHTTWSRDGRTLFYTPGPSPILVSVPVTMSTAFEMGEPKTLNRPFGNQPSHISRPYDVTGDGRFLGVGPTGGPAGDFRTVHVVVNWFEELKSRVAVR